MRKASFILLGSILIVGLVVVALRLHPASRDSKGSRPVPLSFETIAEGSQADAQAAGLRVAKSEAEWQSLWQELQGSATELSVAPPVDFDSSMVIAYIGAERMTGGYAVRIAQVTESAETVKVAVVATQPGQGCFVTQAITVPFHAVAVKRVEKPVALAGEVKTETNHCER